MKKLVLLLMLASLAACGVKNDLVKPNGEPTPRTEKDPSVPPSSNTTGR
jgi:predicted small lipoprotein YifL